VASKDKVVVYTDEMAYGFSRNSSLNGVWYTQVLAGNVIEAIAAAEMITLITPTTAYGMSRNLADNILWYSQVFTGTFEQAVRTR
jgi:hypothetical protein